ncbi:hypothetical protein ES319_D12G216300v1 [Gossypium barbadense]|uniref:Uncharacterized protein n=1 Tax=Gossypium barbadense TaxID=3634 RepID=A0A5J5P1L4_GOSBA|nr:hypothetical protein ES319_D12G216300v1 [Gossypium barbadense]
MFFLLFFYAIDPHWSLPVLSFTEIQNNNNEGEMIFDGVSGCEIKRYLCFFGDVLYDMI